MSKGAKRPRDSRSLGLAASQTLAGAVVGGGIQDTLRRSLAQKPGSGQVARTATVTAERHRFDALTTLNGGGDWAETASGTAGIWQMTISVRVTDGPGGSTPEERAEIISAIDVTGDDPIEGNLTVMGVMTYDGSTDGIAFAVQGPIGSAISVRITATAIRIAPL